MADDLQIGPIKLPQQNERKIILFLTVAGIIIAIYFYLRGKAAASTSVVENTGETADTSGINTVSSASILDKISDLSTKIADGAANTVQTVKFSLGQNLSLLNQGENQSAKSGGGSGGVSLSIFGMGGSIGGSKEHSSGNGLGYNFDTKNTVDSTIEISGTHDTIMDTEKWLLDMLGTADERIQYSALQNAQELGVIDKLNPATQKAASQPNSVNLNWGDLVSHNPFLQALFGGTSGGN